MTDGCISGLQESDVVGGLPAVAVGYDFERSIASALPALPRWRGLVSDAPNSVRPFQNLLILRGLSTIETNRIHKWGLVAGEHMAIHCDLLS
jgi:hypothetical protein